MKSKTKATVIMYCVLFIIMTSLIIWYYFQIPNPKWPTAIGWLFALVFFILWRKTPKIINNGKKSNTNRIPRVKRYYM